MTTILFILLFVGLLAASLFGYWLDHRNGWNLMAWLSGEASSPFAAKGTKQQRCADKEKDEKIQQLQERIQILERIVTEPAYELNQELYKLKR
ncbi:hypothetical protein KJY73_10110 [Bowmanella sp. Y26]|uniref:hypothetical protein n=1 Tax=Bowmanella yangjiangensis TaxID=2811230 RepID=UPI001BDDC302|nr:hypothetical protein [Bowmanella yangjiangensis]MBT1063928.1 hypothetical protein [Bowmanella yangjiangensis]